MLQNSSKNRSEQLIYQKRQQDANISKLSTKLRQEHHEKTFANWENKGKTVQEDQYLEKRMKQLRDQSNAQLEERKSKLAQMLAQEHDQFKTEILDMVETPDQVKDRMKQQVEELKTKKEDDRNKFAQSQYERRFKDNADELRKVESQFGELQAVAYRNMQMVDKQKILEGQYNEEMIYAQLYGRDIKKKERLELEKEKVAREKNVGRNQIVAVQQQLNENRRNQDAQNLEYEKQMLREEWSKEDERNKKNFQDYALYKQSVQEEIAFNNEHQKDTKRFHKQQEKAQDKDMIQQVLAKESAIARMEQENKDRQKEETKQFLLNFKNRANEYNTSDVLREKLIEEENRRQWERKEAQWAKEEVARVKLMYEVYDQRAGNVDHKRKVRDDELTEKQLENFQQMKLQEMYERDAEEKRRIEAHVYRFNNYQKKILQTKENLLKQMDEKQQRQYLLREQKLRDEEQIKKEKFEYERKIENEKAKGRALLDELRKQRPY